jgi:hypothetical protein
MCDTDIQELRRPLGYHLWWKVEQALAEGRVEPDHEDYKRWTIAEFVLEDRDKPITITVVKRDEAEAYAIGMALLEQTDVLEGAVPPIETLNWMPPHLLESKNVVLAWSMLLFEHFVNHATTEMRGDVEAGRLLLHVGLVDRSGRCLLECVTTDQL